MYHTLAKPAHAYIPLMPRREVSVAQLAGACALRDMAQHQYGRDAGGI